MKKIALVSLLLFISYGSITAQQSADSTPHFPDSWTGGQYYTINGAKLWVVSVGSGVPLIIIPGGPGGNHLGYRIFDSLSVKANIRLIYYDAFGRGKSDTATNVKQYTLERDIEDIEGLRKALNLDAVNLLGHSYGSLVAQGYALKYGKHLAHLIIANGFHSNAMWQENDDNSNHEIKTNYPEVWDQLMVIRKKGAISSSENHQQIYGQVPYGFLYAYNPENFVNRGQRKPYPNPFNSKLYYQMVGKDGDFVVGNDIGKFDVRQKLKSLKMPVLIIAGRYDRVAVPWMQVQYKKFCPRAKFVLFEKSGHNPQVEEREKEFPVIIDFLNGPISEQKDGLALNGTWELNYISGSKIALNGLFPNKKPLLVIELPKPQAGGNGGCNGFGCKIKVDGNKINFSEIISTMMACEGNGEAVFFDTLKKITSFSTGKNTLTLLSGDIVLMKFTKK